MTDRSRGHLPRADESAKRPRCLGRHRDLPLYFPGIALLVAGIVVLLTAPHFQSPPCPCPSGETCSCYTAIINPVWLLGQVLVVAAGLYSLAASIALLIAHGGLGQWPRPLN